MAVAPKDNAQQRIYSTLFDAIRKGRYQPGARISIRSAAGELGTSVTPVREALLKLEALGAVKSVAGRSLYIPERNDPEVGRIYRARIQLEGQATAEAAVRIGKVEIGRLRRLDAAAGVAYAANDLRELLALNEELHFLIYAASGNDTLLDLIDLLWLRSGPLLPLVYSFYRVGRVHFNANGSRNYAHSDLIDSLERGDGERARELVGADIMAGLNAYRAMTVDVQSTIAELTKTLREPV